MAEMWRAHGKRARKGTGESTIGDERCLWSLHELHDALGRFLSKMVDPALSAADAEVARERERLTRAWRESKDHGAVLSRAMSSVPVPIRTNVFQFVARRIWPMWDPTRPSGDLHYRLSSPLLEAGRAFLTARRGEIGSQEYAQSSFFARLAWEVVMGRTAILSAVQSAH